jgi:hypothetical protein
MVASMNLTNAIAQSRVGLLLGPPHLIMRAPLLRCELVGVQLGC